MIGEREDVLNKNEYGSLSMRPYVIDGNEINAFYDDGDNLVFVLDNTINQTKPNVLLVINPSGDKKWDEILSGQYGVDLETIRPKQDNKYQKLDIEYSGLSVYENLINAFDAGDDLDEHLVQLNILRDSAARHSAMTRLNVANETITKTNATIVRTKETIVRLQNRVKTLRANLSAAKKEIGRVSTKQSAAKILKLESQIEATNEKLKRAQKRLESAQKRLETATVDAELASDLLNQPALEITGAEKVKPVMVAPKYEVQTAENESDEDSDDEDDYEDEEEADIEEDYDDNDEDLNSDIKPLFDENPNNMNEDIAFKPINFDTPAVPVMDTQDEHPAPVFTPTPIFEDSESETEVEEFDAPDITNIAEQRPVLESMTPVQDIVEENKPVLESMTPVMEPAIEQQQPIDVHPVEAPAPLSEPVPPVVQNSAVPPVVPPVVNTYNAEVSSTTSRSKPTFIYYLLLVILIVLSVFTLWLYQKNMGTSEPLLTANVEATESQPQLTERLKTVKKKVKEKAEAVVAEIKKPVAEPVKEEPAEEYEFADDEPEEVSVTPTEEATQSEESTESVEESANIETEDGNSAPEIMDAVPAKLMTSGNAESEEDESDESAEEITEASIDKPVYEVGPKHDDMIVSESDYQANVQDAPELDAEEDFDEEEYYED